MRLGKDALDETQKAQRRAADPARSAFVGANAGSGKTRVLTERVARLLLAGADPARILCITYTKAAAAEMAHRLFKLLGEWALAGDDKLAEKLSGLEGDGGPARKSEDYAAARRLFARALETPGGLKIQTIHSFCESVLKRFPLEAGVAPGFSVLDDAGAAALAGDAVDSAVLAREDDAAIAAAHDRLAQSCAPDDLRRLLCEALLSRQKWDDARSRAGGWSELAQACAALCGIDVDETPAALRRAMLDAAPRAFIERAHRALYESGGNPRKHCAVHTGRFLNATDDDARLDALCALFLKSDGAARDKFGAAATHRIDPGLEQALLTAQAEFLAYEPRLRAAENVADTAAFLALLAPAARAFERMKAERAALDYDDLIAGVRKLFRTTDAEWVRFKLDQGLDHILLDEAQDTSPAQWAIVEGPLEEFFAGEGARRYGRTFFAVGDQKQSIYSFQGADAGLFAEKRERLGKNIAAVAAYEAVPLLCSFRSSRPVLSFVDALFAEKSVLEGVGDEHPLQHDVFRQNAAGLVELWPRVPRPEKREAKAWDAPLDAPAPADPASRLAVAIAEKIAGWLSSGETLESKGRPIRAGDIMILVQSRSGLFHEMIRVLSQKGVPVAGADKMKLLDDPAVEDLMSYARFALSPADDLSLAEILRSPLFDVDEDSLFELAHGREGGLWRALKARAGERGEWAAAVERISVARETGLKEGPFAFFSHILETGAPSGRKRLFARLGTASAEPVAEFQRQALEYDVAQGRNLQGFVAWAEAHAGEIKRDMEARAESVRVMTVHGSKGLEAPIVFLLDAHRPPNTSKLGPVLFADGPAGPVPVYARTKHDDCKAAAIARASARTRAYEEYRRLLYVAATRARDRLYICGLERGNEKDPHAKPLEEKSWHALAEDAFARLGDALTVEDAPWGGGVRRLSASQYGPPEDDKDEAPALAAPPASPEFLSKPARPERAPRRLSPSRLSDEAETAIEGGPTAFSPTRARDRYLRGLALHRLLELLPEIAVEARAAAADRLLARHAPEIDAAERGAWRDEALAVIGAPDFAPVFGPGSRAEVSIVGCPRGARRDVLVSGKIDRLAVTANRVLVVDYKTNRPPPARIEDAGRDYLAQLAAYRALLQEIYPDKQIESALLWTYEARLSPAPAVLLDRIFAETLGAP